MTYFTIYQITNINTGQIYIGKHKTNNLNDGYMGSGKLILRAIEKYGKESFKKEILFVFDNKDDMNNKERELVNEEYIKQNNYNLTLGGHGGWSPTCKRFLGKKHTEETKKKISDYVKQNNPMKNKEARRKISEKLYGRKRPDVAVKLKGKTKTEEHRKRISESIKKKWQEENYTAGAPKGRKLSEETKKKISEGLTGRKLSKEHKRKLSEVKNRKNNA